MILLFVLVLLLGGTAGSALAQCGPEHSPCYRLVHYSYAGGTYCRRYYSNSVRYFGVRGAVSQQPITQPQISQTIFNAYSNWYFNTALNLALESAGTDTSGSNPRWAVIDNALFSSNWGAAIASVAAVTFNQYYPDGTIKYNRTYMRGDNPTWDWQIDCTSAPCSFADLDLPGVVTHEIGHWWMLDDVEPPTNLTACDSVAMWYQAVNSGVFQRTLRPWDIAGVNHLYDVPTSVGHSFTASPGPSQDTLRWEESDPGGIHDYSLWVSDACWGPHAFLATLKDGDPAHTPDGRFYTFITPAPYARPYNYRLLSDDGPSNATSARTQGNPPAPPSTPTNLTATVVPAGGTFHVSLSWSPSSGTVAAYYIYRHWLHLTSCAVESQAPWIVLGPDSTTSFVDMSPPLGDSLFYRVRAINETGGSDVSNEAVVDLPPTVGVGDERATVAGIRYLGPNPAVGPVEIAYVLPRAGRATLRVYDAAGRLIELVVDEYRGAGPHRARWTPGGPRASPSSVFFLRLALDGEPLGQRRVVVLR